MKTNKLWNFIIIAVLGIIILIWTYFSTEVTLNGEPLPRGQSGLIGVLFWGVVIVAAAIGAYLLHLSVELFSKIIEKFRSNKKT